MSLRLLESFDWSNVIADYSYKYQLVIGAAIGAGRTGPGSLQGGTIQIIFTPKNTWTVGCALKQNIASGLVLQLNDGIITQFQLAIDVGLGVINVYRGGSQVGYGALLGTTVTPLPLMAGQWYHVQVKVVIDSLVGSVEVLVNGLSSLVLNNINTQATANAWVDQMVLGNSFSQIDDLWVNDGDGAAPHNGFMGDLAIVNVKPNGVGDLSAWTPLAGANWQNVDEVPPDLDASYVSSSGVGDIDTYNMEDVGLAVGIRGIQVNVLARKDDAGVRTIRNVYRQAGVNYAGPDDTLNITWKTTKQVMQLDPATGLVWAAGDFNTAQFGPEVVA